MLKQLYTSLYTRSSRNDYSWYIDHLNEMVLSDIEINDRNQYFSFLLESSSTELLNFCIWRRGNCLYVLLYPLSPQRSDWFNREITDTLYFVFSCEEISKEESKILYQLILSFLSKDPLMKKELLRYAEDLFVLDQNHREIPNIFSYLRISVPSSISTIKEFSENIDFKHSSIVPLHTIEDELFTILQQIRTELFDEYTDSYGIFFARNMTLKQAESLCQLKSYLSKWRIYGNFDQPNHIYIKDKQLLMKKIKSGILDQINQIKNKIKM